MRRLASILLWSVIAAAFIGPGTVTAAASAGAGFGYSLLWALSFSTLACLVLQEASGRLTVVSGRSLGQALRERFAKGWSRAAVVALSLGAVVLGCAAYEAGNILGGVAGASLSLPYSSRSLAVAMVVIAAVLLYFNSPRRVALALSSLVAIMGLAFLLTAVRLAPPWTEIARGLLRPAVPEGSFLLAVALVGTTVVPYNLFLGAELARGQGLRDVRFGLAVSVLLGGLISMGVLVVGAAMYGPFSFEALAELLSQRLGPWARTLFGAGLFAAGLSSAVTAPLAAAITARSVLGGREALVWSDRSWRFRAVWGGVLTIGLAFGVSGLRPAPAIILAQALNGVLLPVVALFLLVAVNDARLMGRAVNGPGANALMATVTLAALVLGASGVTRAAARALGAAPPSAGLLLSVAAVGALAGGALVVRVVRKP